MTRPRHPSQQAQKERRRDRKHLRQYRRHKANPCPHGPRQLDAATELVGTFVKHPGRKRHNRWTARLRWPEVTTDADGFPIIIRTYAVVVEYTANGTDWFIASRHQVPGKDDADPGTDDQIVIHHIHGNLAYRYKVRATSKDCKADWSGYFVLGTPTDAPPAPHDVKIARASHGIRTRWSADPDPEDDELFTQDVASFVAQLWTNPDFGPAKSFTAAASDDKLTITSHGFANGDPLSLRSTPGGSAFPGGLKPWKVYYVDSVTTHTFKLVRDEDASAVNITSDGDGEALWGLVRTARHLHKDQHVFRIDTDDFDEDARFYSRVASVSSDRSKSAWIPATAPLPNDDPGATPTGRRPVWHRRPFTFTILGPVEVGVYKVPTRVDDDYRIRRVTGSFHYAAAGAAKFDIKINGSVYVFDGDTAKMLTIADGGRDGSSKQIVNGLLERGDHIRVQSVSVGGTPPNNGTIEVICDRISEGSTTDSGGGGGE